MKARSYQIKSEELIRAEFKRGIKKVLLWLPTGAGKTFVFCDLVKKSVARGKACVIVVRGRKLVDQASKRLQREGVAHGVLMAGHWNYKPHCKVQVCSIDTLIARSLTPSADLIVIDEAHLATSPGYVEWLAKYNSYVLSVTATPWPYKSLRHAADTIIHPITFNELIKQGFLVPFKIYAPSTPNLKGIKIVNNDYNNAQLEVEMSRTAITGKVIDHWIKHANNRATFLFAVNIKHSKLLTQNFIEAGIAAEHCEASTPERERDQILNRLESGATKVVCNVGILCTGVDVPRVSCISMCRPTKSKNLFIQQAGRGTRLFDGKEHCLLLDHAGNTLEHGFPTDEEDEVDLDGKPPKKTQRTTKVCEECFCIYEGSKCPECGAKKAPTQKKEIAESNDELVEFVVPRGAFKNSPFNKKRPKWVR